MTNDEMTQQILPVMRRAEILPAPIAEKLWAATSSIQGFRGLTVSTFIGPQDRHLLGEPLYIFELEGEIQTYKWSSLHAEDAALLMLADLGMSTISSDALQDNIERILDAVPITVGAHSLSILILPQATIMYHEAVGSYVYDYEDSFHKDSAYIATRAPLCTLLLKQGLTAHQMIEEHAQIQQAMAIYRLKTAAARYALEGLCHLQLADPTRENLAQAEPL